MIKIGRSYCLNLLGLLTLLILTLCISCGGGGGDGADGGEFSGATGVGANNVTIFWKYFGSVGDASAIAVTDDGGFIIAGQQGPDFNIMNMDIFVAKTDAEGNEQWRKTFNGTHGDNSKDVKQTSDDGYIVIGYSNYGPFSDVYAIKLDANGNKEWSQVYDLGHSEEGHAVCVLDDGYAIAGKGTNLNDPLGPHDGWFFKIDQNGNKVAGSDRFFGNGTNVVRAMTETGDGGFVTAGEVDGKVFLVRLDADGDEIWRGVYSAGIGYSVCPVAGSGGGFIVSGDTAPHDWDSKDLLVMRVDADGNELWHKIFGGQSTDIGHAAVSLSDGNLLVAGLTQSFSGTNDVFLVKLDGDGSPIWQKVKGMAPQGNQELAQAGKETDDGGIIVAGGSQTQVMLAKFDPNGETVELGDLDFTLTVTETTGLIKISNARSVAESAKSAIELPLQVGRFTLDLFIDTLNSVPPANLCNNGGTYGWDLDPTSSAVTEGNEYLLTFAACNSGPLQDQVTYNGTCLLTVAAVANDLTGDTYDIQLEIDPIDITFTDDVGTGSIEGGVEFSRNAVSGDFQESATVTGNSLTSNDGGDTMIETYIEIDAQQREAPASFSTGVASQYAIVDPDYLTGALTVTILEPIAGTDPDAPNSGEVQVTAQDGSNLIMTLSNGDVSLTVDTDNDGVVDGTLNATWDDL